MYCIDIHWRSAHTTTMDPSDQTSASRQRCVVCAWLITTMASLVVGALATYSTIRPLFSTSSETAVQSSGYSIYPRPPPPPPSPPYLLQGTTETLAHPTSDLLRESSTSQINVDWGINRYLYSVYGTANFLSCSNADASVYNVYYVRNDLNVPTALHTCSSDIPGYVDISIRALVYEPNATSGDNSTLVRDQPLHVEGSICALTSTTSAWCCLSPRDNAYARQAVGCERATVSVIPPGYLAQLTPDTGTASTQDVTSGLPSAVILSVYIAAPPPPPSMPWTLSLATVQPDQCCPNFIIQTHVSVSLSECGRMCYVNAVCRGFSYSDTSVVCFHHSDVVTQSACILNNGVCYMLSSHVS